MAPNGTKVQEPCVGHQLPLSTTTSTIGSKFWDHTVTSTDGRDRPTDSPSPPTPTTELNLKRESDRRKTFRNWPLSFLHPNRLAAAGFYYLKKADLVRCVFCGVEIGKWDPGDDPLRDHRRWRPNCPFLSNQNVGNVPIGQADVPSTSTSTNSSQGYDTCGPYGIEVRPFSGPEKGGNHSLEQLGVNKSNGPMYKDYSTLDARLRSYSLWPVSLKQKPDVLSEAGFYYTGKGDQTVCFHCGGGLKDWEDSDNPWFEHALWFSKCTYVLLMKGKAFVDQVAAEKHAMLTNQEAQALAKPGTSNSDEQTIREEEQIGGASKSIAATPPVPMASEETNPSGKADEARLCKICFTEELGVLFLPCGHIVACVRCAAALSVCAVCRQPFTATVRAYLP